MHNNFKPSLHTLFGSLKNKLVLAPMAGITDDPFRRIVREEGAGLLYSEMISAAGLIHGDSSTKKILTPCIGEESLNVQLFGADPSMMAKAAKICQNHGIKMLDINMGCPVKKVWKTKAGVALMLDPLKCKEIIRQTRSAVQIPLSIKIRSGIDKKTTNAVEIAIIAENEGVDFIAIHPRTRAQQFSGIADWKMITKIKKSVSIPVIGNGDITSRDDALHMLEETGCDMIMIGRAARGNPWIFKEILQNKKPTITDRYKTIDRHMHHITERYGERVGIKKFRKHLLWYMKGFPGAAAIRKRLTSVTSKKETQEILLRFTQNEPLPLIS